MAALHADALKKAPTEEIHCGGAGCLRLRHAMSRLFACTWPSSLTNAAVLGYGGALDLAQVRIIVS